MKILVTGADGFIGNRLCRSLKKASHFVKCATRTGTAGLSEGCGGSFVSGDIAGYAGWEEHLRDMDAVVHLAARCHGREDSAGSLAEFRRINVAGTERLALAAAGCGVRRFVFLSSASVHGESSPPGRVYTEEDARAPGSPYAVSKLEAEAGLRRIEQATGMPVVILRPPLVYGPGVRGTFVSLLKLCYVPLPLPLGQFYNLRSLIGVDNLIHWITVSLQNPGAAGQTFLVSDGEDIEMQSLVRTLRAGMARKEAVFSFPAGILRAAAKLSGLEGQFARFANSFQIDSARIRHTLESRSPYSVHESVLQTASWYASLRTSPDRKPRTQKIPLVPGKFPASEDARN